MFYLIWALINIGLFITFIIISFKATKIIREKWGIAAAIVFVFGLLSFIGQPNSNNDNSEPNSNKTNIWKFASLDSLDKGSNAYTIMDLENTLVSKFSLGIQHGKDMQLKKTIPTSANTHINGFISGTSWEPTSIIINPTNDNQKFTFEVDGKLNWKLLGLTVYSQSKNWKGNVLLK
jgi:hypothetical protein